MKLVLAASLSLALAAPAAHAQPEEEAEAPADPDAELGEPEPAPLPEPEPEPEPEPPPPPPSEPATAAQPAEEGPNRPAGFSVGWGFGWDFPADLQVPDTTSVRFRLPSGLIIEPRLELSRLNQEMEFGGAETTDRTTTIALAAAARMPLLSSRSMDLVGIGGASVAYSKVNPDGADNDTGITALSLFYGIGVDLWIRDHWAVSFTTNNPILLFSRSDTDSIGGDTVQTNTQVGVIFEPDVLLMLHLFFD